MPVLDILDANGRLIRTHTGGNNDAGIQVLAVMAYPNDETKRDEMVKAGLQDALQDLNRAIPPNISKPVFDRGADGIKNDFVMAYKDGLITGETLHYLQRLAEYHPNEATLSRARHLVGTARVAAGSSTSNEKSLRTAWNKFKTVAHFWAAFVDCRGNTEYLGHHKLAEFLGLADIYARFAIRYHAPMAQHQLMAGSEFWEIPLFDGLPIGYLSPIPLNDDEVRRLNGYEKLVE